MEEILQYRQCSSDLDAVLARQVEGAHSPQGEFVDTLRVQLHFCHHFMPTDHLHYVIIVALYP